MATRVGLRRTGAALLALVGLAQGGDARSIAPAQAPRAWVVYAEAATVTITGWLNDVSQPAARHLREELAADGSDGAGAAPAGEEIAVRLWISRQGRLDRAEPAAAGPAGRDADLRALLVGRMLPPPPRRMRQPLVLGLRLKAVGGPHPDGEVT